jgi:penicillin-binding protein 2
MADFSAPQTDELRELLRRLVFLQIGLAVAVALVIGRLWQLQIYEGPHYRDLSENNRTRTFVVEPARGLIYDRNHVLLANNVPSFSLYVTLEDVKDVSGLVTKLVELVGLDETQLRKRMTAPGSRQNPRKLKDGLTLKEAAQIESHRLDLPGVMIQVESQRNYPVGVVAAHLLGYVGEISQEQLDRGESGELHQGSIIGQYGIEKSYDRFLRGKTGEKLTEVDALGHEKRTTLVEKPEAGDDLYLSIDIRLQRLAEELLGEESGAIVAMNTETGEVLALASRPTFNPNFLSRDMTAKQWSEIVQDEGRPLTNRATQGQYPPGSTFKIIMATAALETQTVTPDTRIHCNGGYPFGKRVFHDWKKGGHGAMDITAAMVNSCDVFFYTIGQRMGIETIASYAEQFKLGQPTGIELPSERGGIVPSPAWKEKARNEPWFPGETISAAIGQGYVNVTPMQMTQVIATVANGGDILRPRLVHAVMERATGHLQEQPSVARGRLSVKPHNLEIIRDSLAGVVSHGTATKAKSTLVSIAGKTGTAQVAALRSGPEKDIPKKLRDHAWFVSYAPVEKPRIAVAVLVEHMGHGGSAAAPLAKQVIEAYIKYAGEEPETPGPSEASVSRSLQVASRGSHGRD